MKDVAQTIKRLVVGVVLALSLTSVLYGQLDPPDPGTNAPLTEEQIAAAHAAWLAALSNNLASVSGWLHDGYALPDGTAADFQTIMDTSAADYAAGMPGDWQGSALDSALTWALAVGAPTEIPLAGEMDAKAYLVSIDEFPLYVMPCNVDAAKTISTDKVWPGGTAGLNLNGTNRTIFMWDEGQPRLTHSEFTSRVSALPGNTTLNKHSTSVAGTLVAGGVNTITSNGVPIGPEAKGMSFASWGVAGDFHYDFSQMPGQVGTNNMRLSNHSHECPV
jgi:hypothetical protein